MTEGPLGLQGSASIFHFIAGGPVWPRYHFLGYTALLFPDSFGTRGLLGSHRNFCEEKAHPLAIIPYAVGRMERYDSAYDIRGIRYHRIAHLHRVRTGGMAGDWFDLSRGRLDGCFSSWAPHS